MSRSGHFACLGFDASDRDALMRTFERLWASGATTPRENGGSMLTWQDPSGARIVTNTDVRGSVDCMTPGFDGETSLRARVGSIQAHECRYCDVVLVEVLEGDEAVYPRALQIDDLGVTREEFAPQSIHDLNVTAFLEDELERKTEEDIERNRDPGKLRLAPEALIPSGTFCLDKDPNFVPHAHVILSGRVVRSATRANSATGGKFLHAVVKTLAATVDLVAPIEAAPDGLRAGEIVSGSFWVVGHFARGKRESGRAPERGVGPGPQRRLASPEKPRPWWRFW